MVVADMTILLINVGMICIYVDIYKYKSDVMFKHDR